MVQSSRTTQPFEGLATTSEAFRRILAEAGRAAAMDLGILITGETGTGKEMVARGIHEASRRRHAPFVVVDCASLPPSLIQSELFGHQRGSFSGADRDRVGRFEAARGGTVFLDRVDEMDTGTQAQLLRVIEEREILPVGEARPRHVDFRLLASAGPDLDDRLCRGRFRRDLYWRINVVELRLPALRERPGDIPFLAQRFLEDCGRRFAKPLRSFAPEALEALRTFPWPGNVRELQAAVESAAAAARGERIEIHNLPVHILILRQRAAEEGRASPPPMPIPGQSPPPPLPSRSDPDVRPFAVSVENFQRSLLLEALGRHGWSHREAAQELNLERHQLKYLCAKLGIRRSAAISMALLCAAVLLNGCTSTGPAAGDAGSPLLDFPDAKALIRSSNIIHEVKLFLEMDRPARRDSKGIEIEEPMLGRINEPGEVYAAGWPNPKSPPSRPDMVKRLHRFSYQNGMFTIGDFRYPAEQNALLFILLERKGALTFLFHGRKVTVERRDAWTPAILWREIQEEKEIQGAQEDGDGPGVTRKSGRFQDRTYKQEVRMGSRHYTSKTIGETLFVGPHRISITAGDPLWRVNDLRISAPPGASITINRWGQVKAVQ